LFSNFKYLPILNIQPKISSPESEKTHHACAVDLQKKKSQKKIKFIMLLLPHQKLITAKQFLLFADQQVCAPCKFRENMGAT